MKVLIVAVSLSISCRNFVKIIHLFTKSSIDRPSCRIEPKIS